MLLDILQRHGQAPRLPAQSLPLLWLTLTALEGCFASPTAWARQPVGTHSSPLGVPRAAQAASLQASMKEGASSVLRGRPASSLKASPASHPATKGTACSWWCLWGEHRALSRDAESPQGEGCHLCCPGPCRLRAGLGRSRAGGSRVGSSGGRSTTCRAQSWDGPRPACPDSHVGRGRIQELGRAVFQFWKRTPE